MCFYGKIFEKNNPLYKRLQQSTCHLSGIQAYEILANPRFYRENKSTLLPYTCIILRAFVIQRNVIDPRFRKTPVHHMGITY